MTIYAGTHYESLRTALESAKVPFGLQGDIIDNEARTYSMDTEFQSVIDAANALMALPIGWTGDILSQFTVDNNKIDMLAPCTVRFTRKV